MQRMIVYVKFFDLLRHQHEKGMVLIHVTLIPTSRPPYIAQSQYHRSHFRVFQRMWFLQRKPTQSTKKVIVQNVHRSAFLTVQTPPGDLYGLHHCL